LEGPSDETQIREAAKSTSENEGDPRRPTSASSHDMIPALKSRSAILRAAGIRSCYRNGTAEALQSPLTAAP
jgi:hypothetical protein